jgi:hypothetical protein
MEADRWKKIQELYEAAIALPPEKRADFLEQASPADDGLRGEVQSLLAQPADSFLESAPLSAIKTLSAGARLGNFEIVELIRPRRHGRSLSCARFAPEARDNELHLARPEWGGQFWPQPPSGGQPS